MIKKTKRNFFHRLGKFLDKKIILPLTKFIVKISKKIDNAEKTIENSFTKTTTILFLSLIIAVTLFIIIDQKKINFTENTAEVLKNQTVKTIYNDEEYVIEGLPKKVDVTLTGSRSDLFVAKQSSSNVTIDLTGLKTGTHKVNIDYNRSSNLVNYSVNPSTATVIIYPKISETKNFTTDILNADKLDKTLVIENVNTDTDEVVVKGSEEQLKKISLVKALINVNNIVKPDVGTVTLKNVPLKAYDKNGRVLDVEIVPNKISADVTISSPKKELPIKVIPQGKLGFGKAISSITLSDNKATVYGNKDAIDDLNYIPLDVNISDLKEGKKYKLDLIKPVGVKSMSVNNVTLEITLGEETSKNIDDVNIDVKNLSDEYSVQGASASDIKVAVNVKGVKSAIDQINAEDISAYIDLKGYKEGEYSVPVKVEGTDSRVTYLSKTKKVKVKILKK